MIFLILSNGFMHLCSAFFFGGKNIGGNQHICSKRASRCLAFLKAILKTLIILILSHSSVHTRLNLNNSHTHTHTTHTHAHTPHHTHAHTPHHTQTHTHIHSHIHSHTLTHTFTYTYTHTIPYTNTLTDTHIHSHSHSCMHMQWYWQFVAPYCALAAVSEGLLPSPSTPGPWNTAQAAPGAHHSARLSRTHLRVSHLELGLQ